MKAHPKGDFIGEKISGGKLIAYAEMKVEIDAKKAASSGKGTVAESKKKKAESKQVDRKKATVVQIPFVAENYAVV
ncbi:hypothetical protein PI124_g9846 [Phytophthora idaei]|nr:hypothetical protein PI124_g9846 [Phytophthora idaei]